MASSSTKHLSEEQLASFEDGTLSIVDATHLGICADCTARLEDLKAAREAYVEYTRPAATGMEWRSLDSLIAGHDRSGHDRKRPGYYWLAAAASLAVVGLFLWRGLHNPDPDPTPLLERSERAAVSSPRAISVRMHGQSF